MEKKKLLIISIVLFILSSIAMGVVDSYIQNETTPYGIVSFEFIKSIEASNAALQAWGEKGKITAGISLGLDYLYIVVYTSMMCLALSLTSEKVSILSPHLGKMVLITAYLAPLIGLFDAIENYGLIHLLLGSTNQVWPLVAYYFAVGKFSGVMIVLILVVWGQIYAKIKAT